MNAVEDAKAAIEDAKAIVKWWITEYPFNWQLVNRAELEQRIAAQLAERDARIAELEAAQRWVSVDERLPDDESKSRLAWTDNDGTVTHWMPLPPPPATGLKAMEKRDE